MTYTVALTGGIGSGKSTIANMFSKLHINIIDADKIARKLVRSDKSILKTIIQHFSTDVVNSDGKLNRRIMREIIFSTPSEKKWIDNFFHPLIYQKIQNEIKITSSPYVILVIPLLVENLMHKKVDRVLVVDTMTEIQIQRTMQRDNVTLSHAEQIISMQATRKTRLKIANDIIYNNGKLDNLLFSIIKLHNKYLKLSYSSFIKKLYIKTS